MGVQEKHTRSALNCAHDHRGEQRRLTHARLPNDQGVNAWIQGSGRVSWHAMFLAFAHQKVGRWNADDQDAMTRDSEDALTAMVIGRLHALLAATGSC
jgi:hypothetical protein